MLDWQWKERVAPYWKETAKACRAAGVRVAIEMHPNFVAYNPETMARLSAIAPGVIGCNFDPSHMFWQGIDPVAAIRALGEQIYHVHAKDCRIDAANTAVNGVLDAKTYTRELERSWIFRTVGYGHDALVWKDMVTALRLVGYDHVAQHRARRQRDVRRRRTQEGDRVPEGRGDQGTPRRRVLGIGRRSDSAPRQRARTGASTC